MYRLRKEQKTKWISAIFAKMATYFANNFARTN